MTDWKRLPDRETEDGQILRTEMAEIDGETWYYGTIPDFSDPKTSWVRRLIRSIWRR